MNHLHNNCEGIDASVFSSDMLFDDERRAELKQYIGRWQRAIAAHERSEAPELVAPAVYVVVCANDKPHPTMGVDPGGAIVHESYTSMTMEQARVRAGHMERWGACRIARLVFEDEPGFAS